MNLIFRLLAVILVGITTACSNLTLTEQFPSWPSTSPDKNQSAVTSETARSSTSAPGEASESTEALSSHSSPPHASGPSLSSEQATTEGEQINSASENTATTGPLAKALSEESSDIATETEKDLWKRIRKGFQLDHSFSNKRIERETKWYTRHPAYLNRTFKRSEPYLYHIVENAEQKGVPLELALLPVVESAFDPFAYSHSRAAGIWQFIPGTGKYFGLKQTWWYDGRRDIPASTEAALTYLSQLSERFDGDWLLALAAYNSGAGTVAKAIRKNKKKGKPTDFWNLKLPKETTAYVPRLLAISRIVHSPEKYNISLYPITNEATFSVVELDSQIDLSKAATLAEMKVDDLYLLNPGFNQWATDPEGPHRLAIPLTQYELFQENLAKLPKEQRVQWTRYIIKPGDSLISIARKHKTTPAVLRDINHINGSLIRAGKALLIPNSYQSDDYYSLSADNRMLAKQSRSGSGTRIDYIVKTGDTLWDISREYHVNIRKLASWNSMAPSDILRPGQKLTIWTKATKTKQVLASASITNNKKIRKIGYRVRKGDSLYRIANRYNVSIDQLAQWNGLSRRSVLQPGQKLSVYVNVTQLN